MSARGRDIQSGPFGDYIQTDAAINRGGSGGLAVGRPDPAGDGRYLQQPVAGLDQGRPGGAGRTKQLRLEGGRAVDVIKTVDGKDIPTIRDLTSTIAGYTPGSTVKGRPDARRQGHDPRR